MPEAESGEYLEIDGWCPICEKNAKFRAKKGSWYRGTLLCQSCEGGSVPRERALAYVLSRERPDWRNLRIHECSPGKRGLSVKLSRECKAYMPTHYFPAQEQGKMISGWRNENIEATTFQNGQFDIVISQDVLEHIFHPGKCFVDVYRTLSDDGIFISTFPIRKQQIESHVPRVKLNNNGSVEHLKEPEYHGNPISGSGALVTFDYGYTIHQMIPCWADFNVEVARFCDRRMGVLGEYTEVIICRKGKKYR